MSSEAAREKVKPAEKMGFQQSHRIHFAKVRLVQTISTKSDLIWDTDIKGNPSCPEFYEDKTLTIIFALGLQPLFVKWVMLFCGMQTAYGCKVLNSDIASLSWAMNYFV